ncbi:MAG: squalene/phytoene synthase family protein, partial [Candidatus Dormibacteraceae bacterium]
LHLTRLLRTARADAMQGRLYLPLDEMSHFELTAAEMRGVRPGMGWERIVAYQTRRGRLLYRDGLRACEYLPLSGAAWLRMVAGLSQRILERIASNPRRALNHGVSLPTRDKLGIAMRACLPV